MRTIISVRAGKLSRKRGVPWNPWNPPASASAAEDGAFKFLGMPVRVHSSNDDARSSLQGSLQRMLTVIDETPPTRQQKLRLFKHGVCPRLSWPLLVEDLMAGTRTAAPGN